MFLERLCDRVSDRLGISHRCFCSYKYLNVSIDPVSQPTGARRLYTKHTGNMEWRMFHRFDDFRFDALDGAVEDR